MDSSFRVLITTNIPSPYFVDYATELGKKCDLTVIFEKSNASDRDGKWYGTQFENFTAIFLNGIRFGSETGLSFKVLRHLSVKKYDRIIIANPTTPTGIISLLYCRWFGVPFVIQSEGGFPGSGKGVKEKFKKYIMEKADFYLSGMKAEGDYFSAYGATKDKLRSYPFTSQREEDIIKSAALLKGDKQKLREKLNMHEEKIVLSVGRFSYRAGYGKGYDILMKVAEQSSRDIGFYVVGDAPTQEFVAWKKDKNLTNVHFISFQGKEALAEYYAAADVFVLLTRGDTWGLVVNEAMSFGLPVITTDKCVAGLELIRNGENGYIVSLSDVTTIKSQLDELLYDPQKREEMGNNNLELIKSYTIENMATTIYEYLAVGR